MTTTIQRNKRIVGNNSASYDAKHPCNPVRLRPIHDAIQQVPKYSDCRTAAFFRRTGSRASRRSIAHGLQHFFSVRGWSYF